MHVPKFLLVFACASLLAAPGSATGPATDPGVRAGTPGAGGPLAGLGAAELELFGAGLDEFTEVQSVQGEKFVPDTEPGLGPRFNGNSCAQCHSHPAVGGSSPPQNPQVAVASLAGATNVLPPFITLDGPIREVRFRRKPDGTPDGGVSNLFTIAGRVDAPGCKITQPSFGDLANIALRIPTPTFGGGLIEAIGDDTILANKAAYGSRKAALGIGGHENRSGNDGSITRFGWKAQNKSLLLFAGEAYNVEQGVTNELFGDERDPDPACRFNPLQEDTTSAAATDAHAVLSNIERQAFFMRTLAPPALAAQTDSVRAGRARFDAIGCALCHTPSLPTGARSLSALSNQVANLYSDLLVHRMGAGLADGIAQGAAGPDEFRTAPLWGLGQRVFLLHDGRTKDLLEAIRAHASAGSEASAVVGLFEAMPDAEKQYLLDFLRSL